MGFTTVNCPGKKDDNTALLLGAFFLLNQPPEYTVVVVGTLKDSGGLQVKDGKVTLTDGDPAFLSEGQTNLSDFTSCQTDSYVAATTNTVDGEFTLSFRVPTLNGKLKLNAVGSTGATSTTSCATVAALSPTTFTDSLGAEASVDVNLNLSDRENTNQFVVNSTGYTIQLKTIRVYVKGEYNLQNPTVGENVCDGRRLSGSPRIVSGTLSSSETWSGGILLQGTVFVSSGVTITVSPGTAIFGQRGSSIFFLQGSTLESVGTAADPICWSSASNLGSRFPGDWGGIVTIGTSGATRTTANTEGTSPQPYGTGTMPSTTNVNMAYNIIEFGGNEVAPGDELNNLSMYSSNSVLNHVQAHRGLDDQFEAWGGTGSWNYILTTGGLDDDLDLDEGFGANSVSAGGVTISSFISHKYPTLCGGSASTDPHGLEWDGIQSGNISCASAPGPVKRCTTATLNKFTMIGAGIAGGQVARLREGVIATLQNGIYYGFASGPQARSTVADPQTTVTIAATVRGDLAASTSGSDGAASYNFV